MSTKKRVREITDIVTWVAAFTAFMWILCCTHPSRWQDMTQYKLLILQTAHQFSGKAWLHYDTTFRKDAAASGLTDWSWSVKRHCSRKELESLIGTLYHACKVIPQGRTFTQRMINFSSAFGHDNHPIRLNREFHLDLSWWCEFFIS